MNFVDAIEKEIYKVLTENGDTAFKSSGSFCLDFFYFVGTLRGKYKEAITAFVKAFYEDKLLAIKILFFARDVREGLGERDVFRVILNYICFMYPKIAEQVLCYVPVYGRYDDLLVALNTPAEDKMVEIIKLQLNTDLNNLSMGKEVSLLGKWLPSINASNQNTRDMANKLSVLLNMNKAQYRRNLTALRKGRIIENNLREKDYSFDYSKIPSQAMLKYRYAFMDNDNERFNQYLRDVKNGRIKINTETLYPYQICTKVINQLYDNTMTKEEKDYLDTLWKQIKRNEVDSKTIIVRDGSGSMYAGNIIRPIDVATSLAILFAEQLKGPFKNTFITFSENPQLIKIKSSSIFDKVLEVVNYDECANTNIMAVYQLILNIVKKKIIKPDEMIERIVIISDMEFDEGVTGETTFDTFKKLFEECGYKMPEVVFWNVCNRHQTLPTYINNLNVKMISGASKKIIEMITNNESITPYDFMIDVLNKYEVFNTLELS